MLIRHLRDDGLWELARFNARVGETEPHYHAESNEWHLPDGTLYYVNGEVTDTTEITPGDGDGAEYEIREVESSRPGHVDRYQRQWNQYLGAYEWVYLDTVSIEEAEEEGGDYILTGEAGNPDNPLSAQEIADMPTSYPITDAAGQRVMKTDAGEIKIQGSDGQWYLPGDSPPLPEPDMRPGIYVGEKLLRWNDPGWELGTDVTSDGGTVYFKDTDGEIWIRGEGGSLLPRGPQAPDPESQQIYLGAGKYLSFDDPSWVVGQEYQDRYGNTWRKFNDGTVHEIDERGNIVDRRMGSDRGSGGSGGPLTTAQIAGLQPGQSMPLTFPDGKTVPGMYLWSDGKSVHLMKMEQGMALPQDLITLATADYNGLGEALAQLTNMASGRAGPDKKISWEQAGAAMEVLKGLYGESQRLKDLDNERAFQAEESQIQRDWQAGESELQRASTEGIAQKGRIAQRATAYSGQQADLFKSMVGYAVGPDQVYSSGHGPGGAAAGMAKIIGTDYVPEEHKIQRVPVDFIKMARQGEALAREAEVHAAG